MKIKRLVAMLATAAMAVGLMVVAPTEAKAADELYVTGDFNGWSTTEYVTLSSTDGTTYRGELDVSANSELVIVTAKGGWDKLEYIYDGGEATQQTSITFADAGTYEMVYNRTTKVVTFQAKSTIQVNWTYSYYVAGPAELGAADWAAFDAATAPKMTENNGVYEFTATCTATGDNVEYKIIKYGTPDVSSVSATTEWLGDPNNGGNNYSVANSAKIKFTYNPATGDVTATAVTDGGNGGASGGSGSTGSQDTADVAPVVALVSMAALAAAVVLKKRTVNE